MPLEGFKESMTQKSVAGRAQEASPVQNGWICFNYANAHCECYLLVLFAFSYDGFERYNWVLGKVKHGYAVAWCGLAWLAWYGMVGMVLLGMAWLGIFWL